MQLPVGHAQATPLQFDIGCGSSALNALRPHHHRIAHINHISTAALFVSFLAASKIMATMTRLATPLVNININTIDIIVAPCQLSPSPLRMHPSGSISRRRIHRRPRVLLFPGAVITFCKSLRIPSATKQYPQHGARKTLVASPTQVKTAHAEVDDSIFVHKAHFEDPVGHERGLDANGASSSSISELQARSKSPLSMISCPILEHWNLSALEVCPTLTQELRIYLSMNSTLPAPKSPHDPCPKMKNRCMHLMNTRGTPSHIPGPWRNQCGRYLEFEMPLRNQSLASYRSVLPRGISELVVRMHGGTRSPT